MSSAKANECADLSQRLASTLPRLAECERFGSELKRWFSLIAPDDLSTQVTRLIVQSSNWNRCVHSIVFQLNLDQMGIDEETIRFNKR
jgi:hypothetical protein